MQNEKKAIIDEIGSVNKKPFGRGLIIIFVMGLAFTLTVFTLVQDWEKAVRQTTFELNARSRLALFEAGLIRHQEVVNSIAGLFTASQQVSRKAFRSFVRDALIRQPYIQGLEWIPLISQDKKAFYIQQAQDDGFKGFEITETNVDGDIVKASQRETYMPVYYVEPLFGNEKAMGYNLASHSGRMQAIELARDSGEAVITERVKLVQDLLQDKEEKFGYLLFRAVYRKNVPIMTPQDRRKNFLGVAAGVFRFDSWVSQVMQGLPPAGIDISLYDLSAPVDEQFLHLQLSAGDYHLPANTQQDIKGLKQNLHWQTSISVLGREWLFLFTPAPAFLQRHVLWQAWVVLAAGILTTILLTLYLYTRAQFVSRLAMNNKLLQSQLTERENNELALKSQRDFTDTVLNAASDVIVVLDLDGRIVSFNRAAEDITGYQSTEVMGENICDLLIPEEHVEAIKLIFQQLRHGKTEIARQYENEWLKRNGGRSLFQWHNSVLYDENKNVSHVVAMGYDITQRKLAEAEHERLQRELQQAHKMESLGQLTGGIAHDFNNLLGVINGYASLLQDEFSKQQNPKLTSYIEHIEEAGDRAAKLVAQMLSFSRIEQIADEPIQFEPLIQQSIKMLRATLPSTMGINIEIEENLPYVKMNTVHLHQVLMNLSINARDAMQGAGELTIRLGWVRQLNIESQISHRPVTGDWIELSVSDTGSGVDEKNAKNIFDPFFTTKDVGKGTGMGLSVVYGIMQSHNGHILLESAPGKGSNFRLLFTPALERLQQKLPLTENTIEVPQGDGTEILLVDDEVALGKFMAEFLENHGYKAYFLTDSLQALSVFKAEPERFSILITDMTMPGLTGLDLINKLRQLRQDLPAIICTGYSDKLDAQGAEDLHITFFDKPVNKQQLLFKIAELLQLGKTS